MEFFFEARTHGGTVGILPALRSTFKGKPIEVGIVEGHGGGVADVISFLLRVVVLSLARPRLALVLVLDEPFRHVSLEYLRGCATLLRELNRTAGVQFILVTHKPDLLDAADVVYRTAVENGTTRFEIEHDLRDDVFHQKLPEGAKRREPLPEEVGELRLANESVSLREARSAEFSTDVSPRTLAARVNFAKGREAKKQNELERKRARRRPRRPLLLRYLKTRRKTRDHHDLGRAGARTVGRRRGRAAEGREGRDAPQDRDDPHRDRLRVAQGGGDRAAGRAAPGGEASDHAPRSRLPGRFAAPGRLEERGGSRA
jgi:hypothetical protein